MDLAGTGYGSQTQILTQKLKADGHDVAVSAFYGMQGNKLVVDDVAHFPSFTHPYGIDILPAHAQNHFGGNILDGWIITLIDAWVLDAASLTRANVAMWVPVDHDPIPPAVIDVLEASQCVPIAMTRFGERKIREAASWLDPLYAPHAVDTKVFAPLDRAECRQALGLPESAFVVGMVAANKGNEPPRKAWSQALGAFAVFQRRHPDALLYLHTEPNGAIQGVNLLACLAGYGVPGESVRVVDTYNTQVLPAPAEHMAATFNAFDVLLMPSMGEGFGIPLIESQACGTPVVTNNWTAMPELCGAGWLTEGDPWFTNQGSFMKVPHIDSIVAALEQAYAHGHRLRGQAREFALAYDVDTVYDTYWRPILAELEKRQLHPVAA